MKNIELKIEIDNFKSIINNLRKHGAVEKGDLWQIDTYYHCDGKRLKIREENNAQFWLILYARPDQKEAKVSEFDRIEFDELRTRDLQAMLKKAYGEKVIVAKKRELWLYKNTRIHLDKVEKLGTFLELETLVEKDIASARKEYNEIVNFLELDQYKKLDRSYSDMLLKKYARE